MTKSYIRVSGLAFRPAIAMVRQPAPQKNLLLYPHEEKAARKKCKRREVLGRSMEKLGAEKSPASA